MVLLYNLINNIMNKVKYLFLSLLLLGYTTPSVIYPIYIKEYDVYLYPDKGCYKNYTLKVNDSTILKINLSSCKGSMMVERYDKELLVEKGKYINSLALLKSYSYGQVSGRKKSFSEIIVSEYYQPLRDSVWLFYNHGGVTRKIYNRGVEEIK